METRSIEIIASRSISHPGDPNMMIVPSVRIHLVVDGEIESVTPDTPEIAAAQAQAELLVESHALRVVQTLTDSQRIKTLKASIAELDTRAAQCRQTLAEIKRRYSGKADDPDDNASMSSTPPAEPKEVETLPCAGVETVQAATSS